MTSAIPSHNATPPDAPKRPRRSWTPAEQAAHLADFTASGLSATAFCRRLGIRRATLARWRQRAAGAPRRAHAPHVTPRSGAAGFAAVTVVPDATRDVAHAVGRVTPPSAPPTRPHPPSLTLVLRAPSGVAADVAGLDLAAAAVLLRAVLTPATAPAAGAA